MNIPAASGRGITSLYSHAARLDFTQQHPMDAVFYGRSKLRGISPEEIESAHHYVILERLDIAGAWWTVEKAEQLMTLRVLRENEGWNDYWEQQFPTAA